MSTKYKQEDGFCRLKTNNSYLSSARIYRGDLTYKECKDYCNTYTGTNEFPGKTCAAFEHNNYGSCYTYMYDEQAQTEYHGHEVYSCFIN